MVKSNKKVSKSKSTKFVPRVIKRSCDNCRRRKVECKTDNGTCCNACQKKNIQCVYDDPPKPRGRKKKVIESTVNEPSSISATASNSALVQVIETSHSNENHPSENHPNENHNNDQVEETRSFSNDTRTPSNTPYFYGLEMMLQRNAYNYQITSFTSKSSDSLDFSKDLLRYSLKHSSSTLR